MMTWSGNNIAFRLKPRLQQQNGKIDKDHIMYEMNLRKAWVV